jgi:hypothetical protein
VAAAIAAAAAAAASITPPMLKSLLADVKVQCFELAASLFPPVSPPHCSVAVPAALCELLL